MLVLVAEGSVDVDVEVGVLLVLVVEGTVLVVDRCFEDVVCSGFSVVVGFSFEVV